MADARESIADRLSKEEHRLHDDYNDADVSEARRVMRECINELKNGWCYDMAAAPRDGTLLQLLIKHDEDEDGEPCGGGFDDGDITRTMGSNFFTNTGEEEDRERWVFPGWDWCHDCVVEQGCGKPIAWALMLPLPEGSENADM